MKNELSFHADKLWHYTSPQGLIGIAESKSLWASNIRYLNDATEYLHAVNVARQLLKEWRLTSEESHFLNYLLGHSPQNLLGKDFFRGTTYYVVSLSQRHDRLSQWRAYAGRNGYCVGFKRTDLERLAKKNGFELLLCVYDEDEQKELIGKVLNKSLERWRADPIYLVFENGFWRTKDPTQRRKLEELDIDFEEALARVALVCKHTTFEEEEEVRLVGAHRADSKIKWRSGRTLIVPYSIFDLTGGNTDEGPPETSVLIGPSPEPELARLSVLQMIGTLGWKDVVSDISRIPYRDW